MPPMGIRAPHPGRKLRPPGKAAPRPRAKHQKIDQHHDDHKADAPRQHHVDAGLLKPIDQFLTHAAAGTERLGDERDLPRQRQRDPQRRKHVRHQLRNEHLAQYQPAVAPCRPCPSRSGLSRSPWCPPRCSSRQTATTISTIVKIAAARDNPNHKTERNAQQTAGNVNKHHDPAVEKDLDAAPQPHRETERGADQHRNGKPLENPRKRLADHDIGGRVRSRS